MSAEGTYEGPPIDQGFHWKNGWMFLRLSNGSVRVSKMDDWHIGYGYVMLEIDPHSWASIVASVSRDGEDHGRYYEALAFHGDDLLDD